MRRNYESSVGTEAALVFDNPIVTGINFLHKNPKELVNFVSCQEDPIGCLRVTWHNETTRENLKDWIKALAEAATCITLRRLKIWLMSKFLAKSTNALWKGPSTPSGKQTRQAR